MSNGSATLLVEAYVQSLLDLAEQADAVDAVETDLETISALLVQEPGFRAFVTSPYFAEQTKRDLIQRVFADSLHPLTLHFLFVVLDHNRGRLLPDIIDRYKQSYRALCGYKTVAVTVAHPLRKEQSARLTQDLAEAIHAKVELDVRVDPSIIGGAIFRYGDKMLDNSVRGRLVRTVARAVNPENRHKQE